MHTVKIGDKCWYSSTFSGLIEVKYIGFKHRAVPFSSGDQPAFEVTKEAGPFKKGEVIWEKSFVTPKKLFKRTGTFGYVCTGDFVYDNSPAKT